MSQIAGKKHKYFYYKTFWNILSDVNTLFRSQSLASKVMYEMMKFTGQKYLIATLRPLIDLVGNNSIEKINNSHSYRRFMPNENPAKLIHPS